MIMMLVRPSQMKLTSVKSRTEREDERQLTGEKAVEMMDLGRDPVVNTASKEPNPQFRLCTVK
jgi:hypothetical protein